MKKKNEIVFRPFTTFLYISWFWLQADRRCIVNACWANFNKIWWWGLCLPERTWRETCLMFCPRRGLRSVCECQQGVNPWWKRTLFKGSSLLQGKFTNFLETHFFFSLKWKCNIFHRCLWNFSHIITLKCLPYVRHSVFLPFSPVIPMVFTEHIFFFF